MAHALADNGEADLLAIVQNTSPPPCAGVISVLNHWYGRDATPIGAYKGEGLPQTTNTLSYVADLVANFPSPIKNSSQVPDAVDVYRRVLAAADDHSGASQGEGWVGGMGRQSGGKIVRCSAFRARRICVCWYRTRRGVVNWWHCVLPWCLYLCLCLSRRLCFSSCLTFTRSFTLSLSPYLPISLPLSLSPPLSLTHTLSLKSRSHPSVS